MPDVERRKCPKVFQDRLTRAVGLNPHGQPNFTLEWGQSATYQAGGAWNHDHYFGYRQLMKSNSSPSGKGQPCWMVMEWHPREDYDTAGIYYFRNRDESTGLQILGEYPYRGRYEVAFKLNTQEFRNGRMDMVYYHLDGWIIDWLVPIIQAGQKMTLQQRLKRIREQEEAHERDLDTKAEAMMNNAKRRLLPSQIDDRVRLIQRQMSEFLKQFGRIQPGFKINALNA
jgi:hypothetical protein